ncbi:MAG: PEP-CTERM sorting domain-containing protein [Planctomycetota bacterium]
MTRKLLVAFALVLFSPTLVASTVTSLHDEDGGDGDLSGDRLAPTDVGALPIGVSTVTGLIFNIGVSTEDADIFTFQVGAGTQLDSMMINIDGDRHFLGFDDGPTIDGVASQLLIARLIGSGDSGSNLLTDPIPPGDDFGGQGVSGPLGEGSYTFWVQETALDDVWGYTVTFQTTAIPEPSSATMLAFAGTALIMRRRKRK